MDDLKRVIDALEQCLNTPRCQDCSWESCDRMDCPRAELPMDLVYDALTLLKAQEPRVMTLEELIGIYNFRENHSWVYDTPPYLYLDNRAWIGYWISWSNIVGCLEGQEAGYKVEKYGERWRCWTARPTDEQREKVKWDG